MWAINLLLLTFAFQVLGVRLQLSASYSVVAVTMKKTTTKNIPRCEKCLHEESDPVCGSDGVTYLNACEFNCTQIQNRSGSVDTVEILHEGLCASVGEHNNGTEVNKTLTPEGPQPIIEVDAANTLPQTDCDPFENCNCNYDLLPICGSDFVTYPNKCALQCAVHCDPDLHVYHDGACQKNSDPSPSPKRKGQKHKK